MNREHALVDHDLARIRRDKQSIRSRLHADSGGRQHDVVGVACARIRSVLVERQPLLEQLAKLALPLGERPPAAAAGALPRLLHVHLDEHRQRPLAKPACCRLRDHRAAAEGDDSRHRGVERLARELLLDRAELHLAARGEDRGDRRRRVPFDLGVEIDERTREAGGDPPAERRLAGAHEADEREVAVLYRGAQSIRSR